MTSVKYKKFLLGSFSVAKFGIYGSGEGLRDGIPEKCSFFVTDIHIS